MCMGITTILSYLGRKCIQSRVSIYKKNNKIKFEFVDINIKF